MKLIIGLGNPGPEYQQTRHNVGFMTIDQIQHDLNFDTFKKESKFQAEISLGEYKNHKVILAKPLTFMNRSGESVIKITNFYKIAPKDCLVICDDLDTAFGKIRIRKSGGPGTHNGLKSLTRVMGTDYPRIRVGIENRDPELLTKIDASAYVLGKFNKEEDNSLKDIIRLATEASKLIILDEIDEAMNKFN